MDINKFIDEIKTINVLIEDLTKKDIKKNIKSTSSRIDDLSARIKKYGSVKDLPYSKVLIEFKNNVTLSVRAADIKKEDKFEGRQEFDVVGFTDNYFILQKKGWDRDRIGIKLTYRTIETRIKQKGKIKLFYNKYGDVHTGVSHRSSGEEEIMYEFIKLIEK